MLCPVCFGGPHDFGGHMCRVCHGTSVVDTNVGPGFPGWAVKPFTEGMEECLKEAGLDRR